VGELDLRAIEARLAGPDFPRGAGDETDAPRAAVACVLRQGADSAEVLLIRRAERVSDPWSGHMAFPGGGRAAGDADLLATAERETREEVGLDLGHEGRVLGRLDDLPAMVRKNLVVACFVFAIDRTPELRFDPREVADASWVPLARLASGEVARTMRYARGGVDLELPCWDLEGRVVWGLTYRMLGMLFERLEVTPLVRSASLLPAPRPTG